MNYNGWLLVVQAFMENYQKKFGDEVITPSPWRKNLPARCNVLTPYPYSQYGRTVVLCQGLHGRRSR